MNRRDRRRQISTIAQRPDAGQRFAADMKVATGLHKQNRLKEAVTLYRKITRAYGDLPDVRVAWSNMGAALQMMDKLEDAVAALKKARALNPNHPPPHHNLGMALLKLGREEEGLESLARAIELEPRFRDAWIGFVGACRASGDLARVEDLCRAVLARQPEQMEATLTLGDVMRSQARFAEAEDQYRRCLALDPRRVEPHISLATLMTMTGDAAAGAQVLLEALRAMPTAGPLRTTLLEVLMQVRLTDPAKATDLAEAWAAASPGDETVAKIAQGFSDGSIVVNPPAASVPAEAPAPAIQA